MISVAQLTQRRSADTHRRASQARFELSINALFHVAHRLQHRHVTAPARASEPVWIAITKNRLHEAVDLFRFRQRGLRLSALRIRKARLRTRSPSLPSRSNDAAQQRQCNQRRCR